MQKVFFYNFMMGKVGIVEDDNNITMVYLVKDNDISSPINYVLEETSLIKKQKKQLDEYFKGNRQQFDIPIKPKGTPFQQKVWEALIKVPFGETASYKDIAINIVDILPTAKAGGFISD